MGSGPGNKPSHGGHSYKSGATVVTVLSLCPSVSVFLFPSERWDAESRAYARAEQEQSELEKQKDRDAQGRPVYESKKRVAARPYEQQRSRTRVKRSKEQKQPATAEDGKEGGRE